MPTRFNTTSNSPTRGFGSAPPRVLGTGASASGGNIVRGTNAGSSLAEFIGTAGAALPMPFGKHLAAGQLIFKTYDSITPKLAFCAAIADGGERGCDGVDSVYYADQLLTVTTHYRFHPGTLSTGLGDSSQGQDAFFTNSLTFNNTAYLAVSLPTNLSTEDRPDKIACALRGLLVPDFDTFGILTGWSYSVNPARVAAYGVWKDTRLKYPTASDYELGVIVSRRVDWASWANLKTICDTTISWNDGTTTRSIPRFECHLAFTKPVTLDAFLNAVCATCASWWQDDGGVIRFVSPFDTTIQHHFSDGSDGRTCNILAGGLAINNTPLRERPRALIATFGDTDDALLVASSVQWRDTTLIQKFGEQENATREYPNMTHSQAERLLRRQALLESTYGTTATLKGHGDAFHLLPGDFVTVSSARHGWYGQRCLVAAVDLEPAETTVDAVSVTLQKIDGSLYDDSWHSPKQASVTPV
jgi:hypothetical protein